MRKGVGGPASRRAVLGGLAGVAGAVALGGCWPGGDKPAARATPHPLAPAVAGTAALIDRYQATISAYPDLAGRLSPLLADHRANLDALRRAMGTPASPTASASASAAASVAPDQAGAIATLHAAEQAGQAEAAKACLAAPADYAPLLGSIAACRATHVEVLT